MNEVLRSIPPYLTKQISDQISKDPSIINLSIGEPYHTPPFKLYEGLKASLLNNANYTNIPHRYSSSNGSAVLRREIADRYQRLYGASIDADTEILVTHGAAEAIWLSILTLTSAGDEVIIADPSYIMYETAVKVLGRKPVKLASRAGENFCLNVDDIRSCLSDRTRLLIINSPENPTGATYNKEAIRQIHELANYNNFYFVHDEVYEGYVFDGKKHNNIFSYQSQVDSKAVIINSFSKTFSMMAWRLGWIIANRDIIAQATKMHTNLTLNLGSFHQEAAAALLNDPEVEKEVQSKIREIENNTKCLRAALADSFGFQLNATTPRGGFFLYPNISELYDAIPERFKDAATKGEAVAKYLLLDVGVGVIPGIIYGRTGSDYIRIAVTVEENKILKAAEKFRSLSTVLNSSLA